jgi:hypothetical protein
MKIVRLVGLILVAVFAMSLVAVSAASAAGPLFLTSVKPNPFTGTALGLSFLRTPSAGITVECEKSSSTGEITSTTLAGKIFVHFLECTAKNATAEHCPAMSPGAPLENLIITTTLHGILGLVLPKPASGSDEGLLLLPTSGTKFVTLLGSCIVTSAVNGSVAGLVEQPVGVLSKTGKLALLAPEGIQKIKDIDLTNSTLVEPELVAFGGTSTEEATQDLTFTGGASVEVM